VTRYTIPAGSNQRVAEVRALTGLRGTAAVYVVLFHFFTPAPEHMPGRMLLLHGYLAVDFFFCLSGFVMAMNYSGLFAQGVTRKNVYIYLTRRIARIYPLYIVTLITAGLLIANGLLAYRVHSPIVSFIANVPMMQNWGPWNTVNTPSWSISTEFFSYLLFPLLIGVFLYRSLRVCAIACFISVAALTGLFFYSLHAADPLKLFDWTTGVPSLIRCVAEFSLGLAAYRSLSTPLGTAIQNSRWVTYSLCGTFVALFLLRRTDIAIVMLIPLFIVALSGRANGLTRFLSSAPMEYVGVLSYSIYLLHYLFNSPLGCLDDLAKHHGYRHSHSVATLLVFPLLFLTSALTYRLIELPGRTFLRALFEKKSIAELT
jgi:peptidoglycan/LPS O-acetylase OafA/YrhL